MKKIADETFVCIDCEFTGLDPENDRVIEIAVAKFTIDSVLEQFETLINPNYPISESSIAIHHITQDMVNNKPTMAEILPKIQTMINGHIAVGHGINFDIAMITKEANRANIPCSLSKIPMLDTLRLARSYGESPVNSLEQLRKHFNIQNEGAHRAMNDVLVNMEVFKHLVRRFKTTNQLFDLLSKPILFKIMPLGKHKGRLLSEIPLEYLLWAARKDFDQDLLFSLRTEINRRKKGNSFSQAVNPFHGL